VEERTSASSRLDFTAKQAKQRRRHGTIITTTIVIVTIVIIVGKDRESAEKKARVCRSQDAIARIQSSEKS
jgi:hypothetical protein